MGYYSRVTGSIRFLPPVTYGEVKDSGYVITARGQNYVDKDLELESFGPDSEDSDEIYKIIPSSEDPYKAYDIVDNLEELVRLLGPDRRYEGYIEIVGEIIETGSNPDIYRLRVKDGKVEELQPKLVWPED